MSFLDSRLRRDASCVFLVLATLTAGTGVGWPDTRLKNFTCVTLFVENLTEEDRAILGAHVESLKDALLVAVKAKIPRLEVKEPCIDIIEGLYVSVRIEIARSKSGIEVGYFGAVRLQVLRRVFIVDAAEFAGATVWIRDGIISGPKGEAAKHVTKVLEELVTKFAADYYRAGNP